MNGAKLVLECLKAEGVDTLFGYPGGAVIPLYDALYDYSEEEFVHVRTAHEQGLVHAADGYARSTGKVGVCITTSGPGATNAITGIATAYMDSTPMVVITGQVGTSLLGKDSFQEIDVTGVAISVTKHTYLLKDQKDIAPTIKEAIKMANSGRKGPVLIDIPKDLFTEEIMFDAFSDPRLKEIENADYDYDYETKQYMENIKEAAELIKNSKKPVIYAGGGIKFAGVEKQLKQLSEKLDIPILNSLMGLSSIDRENEYSLGMMGMHGSRECNFAITNSDLIIAIGVRFSDRGTSKCSTFAPNAKIIHMDLDKSEIDKNIKSDIAIIGDLKNTLPSLLETVDNSNYNEWKKEIQSYKVEDKFTKEAFHPKNILNLVSTELNLKCDETVVVTDVGQHQMWTAQYWNFKTGKNFITSGGLGTMGFGLGAAIGAKVGNENKAVVLVTGDGSFRMNMNELATVAGYKIPVIVILINNGVLGMVRQWQKLFANERYSETNIDNCVDYKALVEAFGIDAYKTQNLDELGEIIQNIDVNKPVFIQCDIDKNCDVYPIVPPNDLLENLIY